MAKAPRIAFLNDPQLQSNIPWAKSNLHRFTDIFYDNRTLVVGRKLPSTLYCYKIVIFESIVRITDTFNNWGSVIAEHGRNMDAFPQFHS